MNLEFEALIVDLLLITNDTDVSASIEKRPVASNHIGNRNTRQFENISATPNDVGVFI
jgi:hypothetical protein